MRLLIIKFQIGRTALAVSVYLGIQCKQVLSKPVREHNNTTDNIIVSSKNLF